MTLTAELLRAPHIGVRDLKAHLSERLKSHKPLVVTDHGSPKQVLIPYETILEIVEVLEELNDTELARAVRLSRNAVKRGAKGIPVTRLFNKINAQRK